MIEILLHPQVELANRKILCGSENEGDVPLLAILALNFLFGYSFAGRIASYRLNLNILLNYVQRYYVL